ncbi:hypothetical protein HAX54_049664 [Datura stramonium]|uniref:Uncharacterized protein n=1 Tax=Datura stramonium TaxID=4076 RepID=A0ABS8WKM6_DATST|nr:hypothetical protein [Datura stramonium]
MSLREYNIESILTGLKICPDPVGWEVFPAKVLFRDQGWSTETGETGRRRRASSFKANVGRRKEVRRRRLLFGGGRRTRRHGGFTGEERGRGKATAMAWWFSMVFRQW